MPQQFFFQALCQRSGTVEASSTAGKRCLSWLRVACCMKVY